MPKIILQAGHLNIKTNCDISLRTGTGAGGEVEINTAVRDATAAILQSKGIEVFKVDANYNCDSTSSDNDWDLFLSLHCDMDYPGDMGSGFCDYPEPSTDGATLESQRLSKAVQSSFFPTVGIAIKSRSNANTRYYYMWKFLSAKTPCVLIEMGQVKDAHDSVILLNTQKVAQALSNAVLLALGVENPPTVIVDPNLAKISALEEELKLMRDSRNTWKEKAGLLSKQVEELLSGLDACNANKTTVTNILEAEVTQRKLLEDRVREDTELINKLRDELTKNKPISEYTVKELLNALIKKVGR
jgi:hypothetical protein